PATCVRVRRRAGVDVSVGPKDRAMERTLGIVAVCLISGDKDRGPKFRLNGGRDWEPDTPIEATIIRGPQRGLTRRHGSLVIGEAGNGDEERGRRIDGNERFIAPILIGGLRNYESVVLAARQCSDDIDW